MISLRIFLTQVCIRSFYIIIIIFIKGDLKNYRFAPDINKTILTYIHTKKIQDSTPYIYHNIKTRLATQTFILIPNPSKK